MIKIPLCPWTKYRCVHDQNITVSMIKYRCAHDQNTAVSMIKYCCAHDQHTAVPLWSKHRCTHDQNTAVPMIKIPLCLSDQSTAVPVWSKYRCAAHLSLFISSFRMRTSSRLSPYLASPRSKALVWTSMLLFNASISWSFCERRVLSSSLCERLFSMSDWRLAISASSRRPRSCRSFVSFSEVCCCLEAEAASRRTFSISLRRPSLSCKQSALGLKEQFREARLNKDRYSPTQRPFPYRRKIRLIECKAKCSYLKKLTCKGTLRQVLYLSEAPSPPITPYSPPKQHTILYMCREG